MQILKFLGVFVLGAILGATAMSYLASRASSMYSHSLELSYAFDQQREAALAAKNGQWLTAAMAYHNMAVSESRTGKPFGVENIEWTLSFPLAALVLEKISAASDPAGKGKMIGIGISHARYAYALEKSGHTQEAAVEWEEASKHGAFKSIDAARALAIKLLDQDMEFFSGHQ